MNVAAWATAGNALLWLGLAGAYFYNEQHMPLLHEAVPQPPARDLPPLTIVVAALNEAATIEAGLRSLLAQVYGGPFHVVVVNDRSTDATGAIIDRVAAEDSRVTPVHIDTLPAGWLGKTHALQQGAQHARSDGWLLFTDADVIFAPGALARAVSYAEAHSLDHLFTLPDLLLETPGEKTIVSVFAMMYALRFQTWRLRDTEAKDAYGGVGAFNLVRRAAYDQIGGHVLLRLEVADDVKLGKLIKRAGLQQAVVGGHGSVCVKWQTGTGGMIRGFEKNGFAGFDYSLPLLTAGTLGLLYINVWPFAALARRGATRWWAALALAALVVIYTRQQTRTGVPATYAAAHPVGTLLFLLAMWRSAYLTLRRGGVEWRGTLYPLDELRRGMV